MYMYIYIYCTSFNSLLAGRAGPRKNFCGPGRAENFGPVDTSILNTHNK